MIETFDNDNDNENKTKRTNNDYIDVNSGYMRTKTPKENQEQEQKRQHLVGRDDGFYPRYLYGDPSNVKQKNALSTHVRLTTC